MILSLDSYDGDTDAMPPDTRGPGGGDAFRQGELSAGLAALRESIARIERKLDEIPESTRQQLDPLDERLKKVEQLTDGLRGIRMLWLILAACAAVAGWALDRFLDLKKIFGGP